MQGYHSHLQQATQKELVTESKQESDMVGQWHPKGAGDMESNPQEQCSVQLLVLVSKGRQSN